MYVLKKNTGVRKSPGKSKKTLYFKSHEDLFSYFRNHIFDDIKEAATNSPEIVGFINYCIENFDLKDLSDPGFSKSYHTLFKAPQNSWFFTTMLSLPHNYTLYELRDQGDKSFATTKRSWKLFFKEGLKGVKKQNPLFTLDDIKYKAE